MFCTEPKIFWELNFIENICRQTYDLFERHKVEAWGLMLGEKTQYNEYRIKNIQQF